MVHAEYSFVIPAYNDEKGIARHLEFFSRRQEAIPEEDLPFIKSSLDSELEASLGYM